MFDLIKAIWPFVSEMFFAGKSLKEVILANKLLSALILVLTLSLMLNYFSLGKIYDMAAKRREETVKQGTNKPPVVKPSNSSEPLLPASAASSPDSISSQEENRKKLKDVFRD